jgi:hypothetical protein
MTVEKSGCRPGVGNDHTDAQLLPHGATCVAELGLAGRDYHFSTCSFHGGLHHNGDICSAFLLSLDFELHLYDVGKMTDKPMKPLAIKNRPAAV